MRSQGELDALLAAWREAHWALRVPLSEAGIRQVLSDQGIALHARRLPVPGMTTVQWGVAAITVNATLESRERVAVLAEEYAHAMLHGGEVGELTVHLSACGSGDDREYEADYCARSLLAGPSVSVRFFKPAASYRPRGGRPWNPYLEDPPRGPEPHRDDPAPLGFDPYDDNLRVASEPRPKFGHWPRRRLALSMFDRLDRPTVSDQRGDIVYSNGRTYYVTVEGETWAVHDVAFVPVDGVSTRRVIAPGHLMAKYRYFVSPTHQVRFYSFGAFELRDVVTRHLERQLRDAKESPVRKTTPVASERAG